MFEINCYNKTSCDILLFHGLHTAQKTTHGWESWMFLWLKSEQICLVQFSIKNKNTTGNHIPQFALHSKGRVLTAVFCARDINSSMMLSASNLDCWGISSSLTRLQWTDKFLVQCLYVEETPTRMPCQLEEQTHHWSKDSSMPDWLCYVIPWWMYIT